MNDPTSTYRIQLRAGVDFDGAAALLPYLKRLGIDWLYLSPACVAAPESEHGYDVVDPGRFDPALGGAAGFERLCSAAKKNEMGILLDIVPNHMSARIDNAWWRDMLEHGRASAFAEFFDIAWDDHPESRVVLPVLGRHYSAVLREGELVLGRDAVGLLVRYYEHAVPIDPKTWPRIFETIQGPTAPRWAALSRLCAVLPARRSDPQTRKERAQLADEARKALFEVLEDPDCASALDDALAQLSQAGQTADSVLHALLEEQAYRLCYWRSGLGEINYRRFFDISELAGLQTDRPEVFERVHALLAEQAARGCLSGLRIDHVDGLAQPGLYLEQLRQQGFAYVVVEKILAHGEEMPARWPVQGTTGYEVGAGLAAALTDAQGARALDERMRQRHGMDFREVVVRSKETVLDELFAPSVRRLAEELRRLVIADFAARDVSLPELERAVRALLAHFPVYRTYVTGAEASAADKAVLARAREAARAWVESDVHLAIDFVVRLIEGSVELPESERRARDAFVRRFQQLSGPVAAKGVEDTALYRWTALPGLCEVGAEPSVPDDAPQALIALFQQRLANQPGGLNTTSSHDSKRSEDARCRLLALSQFVQPWIECSEMAHAAFGAEGPESKDEIDLLLQSYLAIAPADAAADAELGARLEAYVIKAARESKRSTSWMRPSAEREALIRSRVVRLMSAEAEEEPWRVRLEALRRPIALAGAIDSLAQTVLKVGAPGVADVYRGTETWDSSLVDPDNRRPVDFEARERVLRELDAAQDPKAMLAQLRHCWSDGRIKTWILSRALRARAQRRSLFLRGEVEPAVVDGPQAEHVIALWRSFEGEKALIMAARTQCGSGCGSGHEAGWPIGEGTWGYDTVATPEKLPLVDALTDREHEAGGRLRLSDVFADLPVALLVSSR